MALHLVRLKIALMRGAIREAGTTGVIGFVVGALFSVGFGAIFGVLLLLVRRLDAPGAGNVVAFVFLALLLGWVFGPILALAADNTLDIDRLALLPLRAGQLMPGLLLAAPIGFGGLFTTLLIVGVVGGMAPAGPGAVLTIAAAISQVALLVATSRLVSTGLSAATRKRRWRDVALFVGPVLALAVNLVFQLANRSFGSRGPRPGGSAGSLFAADGGPMSFVLAAARWLPSGWAAQAMTAARRNDVIGALAGILGTAAITVVVLWLWWRVIQVATTTASVNSTRDRRERRLLPWWMGAFPPSTAVAVAAKEMRCAWRDPRQRAALLGSAFGGLAPLLSFSFVRMDNPRLALLAIWPAIIIGATATNLFGFDGAEWWTNVAAGARIRDELMGRTAARFVLCTVSSAGIVVVFGALSGVWFGLIPAMGLAVAAGGVSIGFGAVTSVTTPVPVPPPGRSNAFGGGNAGTNAAAGGAVLAVMMATLAVLSPLLIMTLVVPAGAGAQIVVAILGVGLGVLGWRVGLRRASKRASGREVDLLAKLWTSRA